MSKSSIRNTNSNGRGIRLQRGRNGSNWVTGYSARFQDLIFEKLEVDIDAPQRAITGNAGSEKNYCNVENKGALIITKTNYNTGGSEGNVVELKAWYGTGFVVPNGATFYGAENNVALRTLEPIAGFIVKGVVAVSAPKIASITPETRDQTLQIPFGEYKYADSPNCSPKFCYEKFSWTYDGNIIDFDESNYKITAKNHGSTTLKGVALDGSGYIVTINVIVGYPIYVGKKMVTEANKNNVLNGGSNNGKVTFDPNGNKLTLNGANLTETAYSGEDSWAMIYAPNTSLRVILKGKNTMKPTYLKDHNLSAISQYGEYQSLVIDGDGSLDIDLTAVENYSYGIGASNLFIEGSTATKIRTKNRGIFVQKMFKFQTTKASLDIQAFTNTYQPALTVKDLNQVTISPGYFDFYENNVKVNALAWENTTITLLSKSM